MTVSRRGRPRSQQPRSQRSQRALAFFSTGAAQGGIGLLFVTVGLALVGPMIAPYDPTEPVGAPFAGPGPGTPLGTDQLGRDVWSRVLAGGIHLAWMAPLSAVLSVGLGGAIGLLAASLGGWRDAVLMRFMDVLLAFPGILLALLFVSVLGPRPWLLVALVVVALLPGVARVMRGAALPVMRQEFVLWARAIGMPTRTVLWREVLPNVTSPLLVELGIRLMWSIGILASISFIGYGIQPPTPDWGLMVSENRTGLSSQPLAVLVPILMIAAFTVSGNLLAETGGRVIARTEGKERT